MIDGQALRGLLLLQFAFVALICWELNAPVEDTRGPDQPRAALSTTATPPERTATKVAERRSAAMASSVLQRPLFRPDRRPVPPAGSGAPPGEVGLPRLAGIIVTASARTAIFADGGAGKPVVVVEGGSIGPVRMAKIAVDQVTAIGPDGAHTLRPAWQAAFEQTPPTAVPLPSNTFGAGGATFGAIPVDRLALLRGNKGAFLAKLRQVP